MSVYAHNNNTTIILLSHHATRHLRCLIHTYGTDKITCFRVITVLVAAVFTTSIALWCVVFLVWFQLRTAYVFKFCLTRANIFSDISGGLLLITQTGRTYVANYRCKRTERVMYLRISSILRTLIPF